MGEGSRYASHFTAFFVVSCVSALFAFSTPSVRESVSLYIDSPYGRLIDGGRCFLKNGSNLRIRGGHLVLEDGVVFASFEKVANDKIKLDRVRGPQMILHLERIGGLWDSGVAIHYNNERWIYC